VQLACLLAATGFAALLVVRALAVTLQSNFPIKVAASQTGAGKLPAEQDCRMAGMLSGSFDRAPI